MPNTVYKLSRISRLVLYYLTDHGEMVENGDREIVIGQKTLSKELKVSLRGVQRAIRTLEALGYVTTYMQVKDYGDYGTNKYVIHPITAPFAEELIRRHYEHQGVETKKRELIPFVRSGPVS